MRQILVIGIGAGDPEHVTVQAVKALNRADVFFVLDKGEEKDDAGAPAPGDLRALHHGPALPHRRGRRTPSATATPADYGATVEDWHAARAELYEGCSRDELGEDECGAFLVWGDPSLYDSTLRIIDRHRGARAPRLRHTR